jgi:hypothetical protein
MRDMPRHDHRHDARAPLAAPLHVVDIESGVEFPAAAIDGTGTGLAFDAPMEPALGAEMEVTFRDSGASSLFKVLRIEVGSTGFRVAGTLRPRWADL